MEEVTQESRERYARRGIQSRLRQVFDSMDLNSDGKLNAHEIKIFLKKLGYTSIDKTFVENMIWEVDESYDNNVSWEEFELAYERCSNDKNGTEPRQLYFLILFCLHTAAGSAAAGGQEVIKMKVEDARRLMYLQHGRDGMETELEQTFGKLENKQGLRLEEFLRRMTARSVSLRPKGGRRAVAAVR